MLNTPFNWLSHKDSNLNWLNQNQMCYHYTMGQSLLLREKQCKSSIIILTLQIFILQFGRDPQL